MLSVWTSTTAKKKKKKFEIDLKPLSRSNLEYWVKLCIQIHKLICFSFGWFICNFKEGGIATVNNILFPKIWIVMLHKGINQPLSDLHLKKDLTWLFWLLNSFSVPEIIVYIKYSLSHLILIVL